MGLSPKYIMALGLGRDMAWVPVPEDRLYVVLTKAALLKICNSCILLFFSNLCATPTPAHHGQTE